MRPFYWTASTNFGDAMNGWLWKKVFPDRVAAEDDLRLVGVGSLIKKELSYVRGGRKIIFGTGSGYGDFPSPEALAKWKVYFVRGPLTAKMLGLDAGLSIVDASWLIGRLPEFAPPARKSGTIFIPHFSNDISAAWRGPCEKAGLEYVSPLGDSVDVIKRIASAELAVVESLHGAIIADFYRTPWIPLQLSKITLPFKWMDWCDSVGLQYRPFVMPLTDVYHHAINRKWPAVATGIDRPSFDSSRLPPVRVDSGAERAAKEANPGLLYMSGQKLRGIAREGLGHVRGHTLKQRNIWPLSRWNAKQEERLALLLKDVVLSEPMLSKDSVRESLLSRLDEKVAQLIADYPRLVGEAV